ncbi:MAG TPA: PAS domain-containing protein, partial [Solirubrobacteraceae bacterium]
MLATIHLPQLGQIRRWPTLGTRASLVVALLLFGLIFLLRVGDPVVADAEGALFVVPIGVLALRFGLRGALGGAAVSILLVFAWGRLGASVHLLTLAYVIRATTLVAVAILLGTFVEHRRKLEAGILRYYDASVDLLATGNVNGRLMRVNPAWERVLGFAPETLYSQSFISFVHPDDRTATFAEMRKIAAGGEALGFRNRFRTDEGGYRWLEWSASAAAEDGVVHAVARDVTAQHEAEHQLADNARTLESMIAERTRELDEA